jgi:hypothetical protein
MHKLVSPVRNGSIDIGLVGLSQDSFVSSCYKENECKKRQEQCNIIDFVSTYQELSKITTLFAATKFILYFKK